MPAQHSQLCLHHSECSSCILQGRQVAGQELDACKIEANTRAELASASSVTFSMFSTMMFLVSATAARTRLTASAEGSLLKNSMRAASTGAKTSLSACGPALCASAPWLPAGQEQHLKMKSRTCLTLVWAHQYQDLAWLQRLGACRHASAVRQAWSSHRHHLRSAAARPPERRRVYAAPAAAAKSCRACQPGFECLSMCVCPCRRATCTCRCQERTLKSPHLVRHGQVGDAAGHQDMEQLSFLCIAHAPACSGPSIEHVCR